MSGTIAFPPNPTVGQTYTFGGATWIWNGTVWANATTGANFLPLTGGTMTGPLVLAGNASSALQAPSYQQVSGLIPENYVDNSSFTVNQRSYASGTALAAGVYGFDRWKGGPASGGTLTFTTSSSVIVNISAGSIQQVIDGFNMLAQPYTLSWAGTATGRISTTSGGGTYAASPVQFNGAANTNAFIEFTGGTLGQVQLQLGSVATPWQRIPVVPELMRCLRYFLGGQGWISGYSDIARTWTLNLFPFPVPMRTTPTMTAAGFGGSNSSSVGVGAVNSYGWAPNTTTTGTGMFGAGVNYSATADL